MNRTNKQRKIPVEVSVHLRFLHQEMGLRGRELTRGHPEYSRASIYPHAKKRIGAEHTDKRHTNPGRPRKLTERDRRSLLQNISKLRQTTVSFTVKRLSHATGTASKVSHQTVRRLLHRQGYRYFHSRKKELLTKKDLQRRLKFAHKVRRLLPESFRRRGMAFYFDGAGYQHMYNPHNKAKSTKTMAWHRQDEGLLPGCTAKGSHCGSGGPVARFFVTIGYNKGVILCEHYDGRINREKLAKFVKRYFKRTFRRSGNSRGKLFLQDGDPSQNSRHAKRAMDRTGARLFNIPPRSPDCNPIENVFNVVKQQLHQQALEREIVHEEFETFSNRVK